MKVSYSLPNTFKFRRIIILILMIGCVYVLYSCTSVDEQEKKKPNILFILIDDQRNDVLSCAGHPIVKTPTVDKLAEKGIRFTNAYVTTSICAASRASILTGLYERTHNFTFGKPPLQKTFIEQSYPSLLKEAGYSTAFVGKLGVKLEEQETMLNSMFDYYRLSPINSPYVDTLADGRLRHSSELKGEQAIEFIQQQSEENPFCLSISFNAVHAADANKTPGKDGHYPYPEFAHNLYEEIEMPAPRLSDPQIFDKHPDFLKQSLNRERYFWRWDTKEKYQINMKAYFRMISGYDEVIKKVFAALEAKGLAENTIIIYSADNGYYMGNRGFAGKWSHYEESLRVPLIIYDPRKPQISPQRTSEKLALNIDIPATILDYAGIDKPEFYQGESLLKIVENNNAGFWRKSFYCEHRMDHPKIPKYIGMHDGRYVYANYYEQDPTYEYFHDLEKDPDQLENLIDDPAYAEIINAFRQKCENF